MLTYAAIASLDGYVNDSSGGFGWAAPDDEVHAFVNDLERHVGTYLYGRRMYEVMRYWDGPPSDSDPVSLDYAGVWQATDKVVYSRTLREVTTPRTQLLSELDLEQVRALAAAGSVTVGGATLAGQLLLAGVVDEVHLLLHPVTVGGGTPALPGGAELELVEQRRFDSGVVHLRYRA
ncbi:MAG: deaminase [Frankiales bacterium]|nr:deaminase [Frankiales bacterium]